MAIQDLKASLDLKQNLNIYTTCKQFDNLNLILSIFDNSLQADLTNYDVRLRAMKADNVPLIQQHIGIDIDGNVVNIQADAQLTTTAGNTPIELQFIDKSTGEKKATFNLVLVVVASAIAIEASISKATYTLLEELEKKLDQLSDFFEHIGEAIEANTNLENTIANSENAKTNLDSSILVGNTLKESLNNIISTGNTLKTNLENDISIGDTLKEDLGSTISTGDSLLNSLETFEQEHADVTDISNKLANINSDLSERANTNLLINADFQVWQRGTSFTAGGYSADRWRLYVGNGGSITQNTDGTPKMKKNIADTSVVNIQQEFESSTVNKLKGKTMTLSVNCNMTSELQLAINDGSNWQVKTIPSNANNTTYSFTFTLSSSATKFLVMIQLGNDSKVGEVNINWAKLELGSIATPFIPRLTGEERVLCERYYKRITSASSADVSLGSGIFSANNTLFGLFKTSVPMRITPTFSYANVGSLEAWGWAGTGMLHSPLTNFYLYTADTDNTNIGFSANTTSTAFTVGYPANLQITRSTNGWIALDAEIY